MSFVAGEHPFRTAPHRTVLRLSFPIFLSLVAEPLTGLVDTAFVSRLGATPLAAMGLATTLLSAVFWIFFFLGVGVQTEVAAALGARDEGAIRVLLRVAGAMAVALGLVLACVLWPLLPSAARLMGADGAMEGPAVAYLEIRLLAAPAAIFMMTCFGVFRGLHDVKTPLWIAAGTNALNVALDWLLIFGAGPVPALGFEGAAWASAASQWVGAAWALLALRRFVSFRGAFPTEVVRRLTVIGRDMFLRTGTLSLYLVLATRAATELGADSGAAHEVVRKFWLLTALVLDAYAATAQSLIAFFIREGSRATALRVARITVLWGLSTGLLLCLAMALGTSVARRFLPPDAPGAAALFAAPWLISALFQPLNAVSFVTDGIHWGTRDYAYLRNAMFAATGLGGAMLLALELAGALSLPLVWWVTAAWIAVRGALGVLRVWPGIGRAPLAVPAGAKAPTTPDALSGCRPAAD